MLFIRLHTNAAFEGTEYLNRIGVHARAADAYTDVDLKRFSGHRSLRSLERYIAESREAAKRKAREWER
jgi:hypothetical protein